MEGREDMLISYLPNAYSQQRQREKAVYVYPVLLAMEAEYYKKKGEDVVWDWVSSDVEKVVTTPEGLPFLDLPYPNRVWSNAFAQKYQNYGNYKHHPATHMQVANGCWWGKCVFCVEKDKPYLVRPIEHVMEEIDNCHALGFKEIFDDSGTFPTGEWLERFCIKMRCKPYDMTLGCNMRIGAKVDYKHMKQAGFRMVLFGIESANQHTLDRMNKGIKAYEIIKEIKNAAKSGIEPHIAVMFGQPWTTQEEELETLALVHYLLRKGYAKTAQASLYTIPGMASIDRGNVRKIYNAAYNIEFWYNKIKDIRTLDDIRYILRGIKEGLKK